MEEQSIEIRSAEPADAEAISELLGSPGVFEHLLQMPDAPIASRVDALRAMDPQTCRLVAVDGATVVAHAGLFKIQNTLRRQHVRGLGIAVASTHQGRGLGQALIQQLLAWDNWGSVLRVELTVYTDNARAISLYSRLGFVEEGLHRAFALRDGHYVDAIAMARIHPRQAMLPDAAQGQGSWPH